MATDVYNNPIQGLKAGLTPIVGKSPGQAAAMTAHAKIREDAPPMKALTYHGKKSVKVENRGRPMVTDPEDIVIKVTSTCICGSDLHLYNGYMIGMHKHDILGHEMMGVVEEVGPEVNNLQKGDRVVVCFDIACGRCNHCKKTEYSTCDTTNPSPGQEPLYGHRTAALFGYSHMMGGIEGGQAEYARVPLANTNTIKIPADLPDDKVVFLSDIAPTAWHGCEMGEVGPGRTVAVWGAGPVGMLCAYFSVYRGASKVVIIDSEQYRLDFAKKHIKGLETINYKNQNVKQELERLFPDFKGPDTGIECVGFHYAKTTLHAIEQKLSLETDPADIINEMILGVRKGGCISIIGAYAGLTNHFNIGAFMEKGMTMRGGQCPVQRYWQDLLAKIQSGEIDVSWVITHVIPLDKAPEGYKIFNEKTDNCVKVVLKPGMDRGTQEPAGP